MSQPTKKKKTTTPKKKRTLRIRKYVNKSNTKRPHKKVNKWGVGIVILCVCIALELIAGIAGLIVINRMQKDEPTLNINDFLSAESTKVYDVTGQQVADVGITIRENVSYNEISEALIDAFVAVEDSRYFEHDGFDLPRFTRSMLATVEYKLTGNGSVQGGSTFTMQLVKLTYFQNDEAGISTSKDIEYKVQQISLAKQLEEVTDKKTIFEMYLNKMNYGGEGNIRGIEKAAQYYYGKSAGELNLAEAAMLAGVVNSPYSYDPHNYLDLATSRRNTVLYLMRRHGYITKEEYDLAVSIKVEDTLIDPDTRTGNSNTNYQYQAYIDTVIKETEQLTGMDPLSVQMDIYTYMDSNVQSMMDSIQAGEQSSVQFPDDLMEMGAIVENNQTGQVIAIAGGRNYGRGGSMLLNHATDQYKQPGSTVKPFLDYAAAFEYLGWASDHVVTDRPVMYEDLGKVVGNANGQYYGQVTLTFAIQMSLNTPAILALQDVISTAGWQTVANYIDSFHFSQVDANAYDIGYAIGGSTFVVSCEELMAAHATLMNGGYYIEPHTVQRIEFPNSDLEAIEPYYAAEQVMSSQAAYLAAELMYDTIHGDISNYLQILTRSYQTFGKTGTTDWGDDGLQYNIPEGAAKDRWMVAETSEFTIVTWVGYEKGILDAGTYFDSAKSSLNLPGNICSLILDSIYDGWAASDLVQPDGLSYITHVLGTFPYVTAYEGIDAAYVTTGLVKSEYAYTVDPPSSTLETLEEFDAGLAQDGSVNIAWTPYPDDSAVNLSSTMDISLYDSSGNLVVEAYGNKLFDWNWIYGPVRYMVRISQNGEVIDTIESDTEFINTNTLNLRPGTATEACGYYSHQDLDDSSNEICVTFTSSGTAPTPTPSATPESQENQNNRDDENNSENNRDHDDHDD